MSISGNIRTMELAELFQWLSQSRKTGTLVIDSGQVEKRVYFNDGRIVSSAATDPKELLGHFLVGQGYIDEMTLLKAMEMQEEKNILLGKILVSIGAITEEELENVLRLRAEESIYEIFTWEEGEFQFLDGELPDLTLVPVAIDVTGLVLGGLQRLDEWNEIRKLIPSKQCVPVAIGELTAPEGEAGAKQVLQLVDDDRTVDEIALQAHSSEFFVCRALHAQVERGALKVVRPRLLSADDQEAGFTESIAPESLIRTAERLLAGGDYSMALRHLRAARSLEPDSSEIQTSIERAESKIREQIERAGIRLGAVPVHTKEPEELSALNLTSQEGFIFTRVNGTYDLQTILKISPMPPLDAEVVIWKLLKKGLIRLDD